MVTYGEVCVLGGEPHHCLLHSVLYGLSAVAEFLLVFVSVAVSWSCRQHQ